MSYSFRPHGLQHTSLSCPSPTPGAYLNSCPLSRCCHPTMSSSVVPFSSCPQSFPASGSFQMSQFFASGGQSIGIQGLLKQILSFRVKIMWEHSLVPSNNGGQREVEVWETLTYRCKQWQVFRWERGLPFWGGSGAPAWRQEDGCS